MSESQSSEAAESGSVEDAKQETRNWFAMADRMLQGSEQGDTDWENVAHYLGIAAQWAEKAAQSGRRP